LYFSELADPSGKTNPSTINQNPNQQYFHLKHDKETIWKYRKRKEPENKRKGIKPRISKYQQFVWQIQQFRNKIFHSCFAGCIFASSIQNMP